MLFSVSSSTRCLVTLSCVVVGLFQPHALMGVQAADGAMAAAKAVAANTTTTTSSTIPALDCAAGTAAIYSAETLNSALDAAIDGMIALQDPLSCTTGGDKKSCTYDYNKQDANFQAVCTSAAVQGEVVDRSFDIRCNNEGSIGGVTYTFLQAPLCVSAACDGDLVLFLIDDDTVVLNLLYTALVETTDAIAVHMNNITGINDCKAEVMDSAGRTRMNGGVVRLTLLSSALVLAMTSCW